MGGDNCLQEEEKSARNASEREKEEAVDMLMKDAEKFQTECVSYEQVGGLAPLHTVHAGSG